MAKLDHARTNARDRMRSRGTEQITDFNVPAAFRSPPKRRPSKAAMRVELAEAVERFTRIVKCRCGHSAAVALPAAKLHAKLRCSRCGSIAEAEKEEPAGLRRRVEIKKEAS